MVIVRTIVYEGTEEKLREIMPRTLKDGSHTFGSVLKADGIIITLKTIEGDNLSNAIIDARGYKPFEGVTDNTTPADEPIVRNPCYGVVDHAG